MTVKECFARLDELKELYDKFIVYTDEYKRDDDAPMLHDICIALSDFRYYLTQSLGKTKVDI